MTGRMVWTVAAAALAAGALLFLLSASAEPAHTCEWGASSVYLGPSGEIVGPETTGCVPPAVGTQPVTDG